MALYFIKPVVWNDRGYQRPGGAKFQSGYPAEHGFGQEEWNHSDHFEFSKGREKYRVFHTEQLGNQPLSNYNGRILVFLIASFAGNQYLVSIAGSAVSLFDEQPHRRRLTEEL